MWVSVVTSPCSSGVGFFFLLYCQISICHQCCRAGRGEFLGRGVRLPTLTVAATVHLLKALQCALRREKSSALPVQSSAAPS